jgi:hypothetical protein
MNMRSKKVPYAGRKTIFTHAYLKRGVEYLLQLAESNQEGGAYTSMMSLVATAFFLEAYLNHIGSKRLPCWSLVERSLSPNEKLSLLHKHLGIKPDWGKRPYQSFKKVFDFRNLMAHGKTQTVKGKWKSTFGRANAMAVLQTEWEKVCNPKKARQLYEDGEKIVEELHRKAGLPGRPFGTMAQANASG